MPDFKDRKGTKETQDRLDQPDRSETQAHLGRMVLLEQRVIPAPRDQPEIQALKDLRDHRVTRARPVQQDRMASLGQSDCQARLGFLVQLELLDRQE